MCSQTTLNKILKEIRKVYEDVYGDKLVKVLLYGSYARGDYDNESDIDVVGIVRENRIDTQSKIKKIGKVASDLGMENDIYISLTAIPYNESKKYMDYVAYYRNIDNDGIDIGAWFRK